MGNYRVQNTKYYRGSIDYKDQHCFFLYAHQTCHVSGSEHAQVRNDPSPRRGMYTPDEVLYHVSMPEWFMIHILHS